MRLLGLPRLRSYKVNFQLRDQFEAKAKFFQYPLELCLKLRLLGDGNIIFRILKIYDLKCFEALLQYLQ